MLWRGARHRHTISGSAGILILAVLAIVYTLYFGKEILLPIALALVLKLQLQPAMRLLHVSMDG
jgi:predicted PurR-regulated permease PerM